ncbi:hydroxyacid dehydrogenase [Patescibacteria group bacterium]
MRILSFYNEPWEREYLTEKLAGQDIEFFDGHLQENPDVKDDKAEILTIFVKSKIGAEELDRFPNLKAVVTRSTGFDHIDLEECKKRNITVSNVPTYGENTVAEMAFALLLALSRRVYDGYKQVVEDGNFSPKGLTGFDLKGRTLGVVGSGHIGQYAIRMGNGFGMKVIAFDVHQDKELSKDLGFEYVSFDELLEQSDVVTLHVPYNEHTHHMINQENVSKMKKDSVIINTARGPVLETDAVIKGLQSGTLAGAGLDVLEEEDHMLDGMDLLMEDKPNSEALQTVLQNQYLIDHPNVIITPHNAFNTTEALKRILDTTVENINAASEGKAINLVN